jgi:hypothetical protein
MYFLVLNEKIVDVADQPFPVHESMEWVETQDESISHGYSYKDGVAAPPLVKVLSVDEKREQEYPTEKELVIALWEKVFENDDASAQALQEERLAVKAKYPR